MKPHLKAKQNAANIAIKTYIAALPTTRHQLIWAGYERWAKTTTNTSDYLTFADYLYYLASRQLVPQDQS